jgi:hypothetical protein
MDFTFSMDNYYLLGAIALALLLVVVGAFMYLRGGAPADETDAGTVYEEVMQDEMPPPEGAGNNDEHAHAE